MTGRTAGPDPTSRRVALRDPCPARRPVCSPASQEQGTTPGSRAGNCMCRVRGARHSPTADRTPAPPAPLVDERSGKRVRAFRYASTTRAALSSQARSISDCPKSSPSWTTSMCTRGGSGDGPGLSKRPPHSPRRGCGRRGHDPRWRGCLADSQDHAAAGQRRPIPGDRRRPRRLWPALATTALTGPDP